MKVKKLIKKLKQFDPEAKVFITGAYGSHTDHIFEVEQVAHEDREQVVLNSADLKKFNHFVIIGTSISSG